MTPAPPLRTPRHPRYRIVRRLGSGGSSSVYLARDLLEGGQEVALKASREEIAPDVILREFRILRDLRHPGIARAHDFGRLPGRSAYFTMEYIAGPDLERWSAPLRRHVRPEDPGPLLDAFLQVADALAFLHSKGLLHLDVKPSNVVFCEGEAKLIDFGLFQNLRSTALRRPKGTAYFSAPEVFEGGPVDRRADLYSLGVSLYRAFTGRYPIRGRTVEEIAENHRRVLPGPPRGLPPALVRVIQKLLAKSPAQRFQSADEVAAALRELPGGRRERRVIQKLREASFTGRRRELEEFFAWFEDVRAGRGAPVLRVEGEAGIGKSRFAEACVTEALSAGARVLPLRCFAGRGLQGLRALVEKALVLVPLGREERSARRFLLSLLGLRPDPSSQREAAGSDLEWVELRAFQEALGLLAARASPVLVVVVEDLHRGDPQLGAFVRWLGSSWPAHVPRAPVGLIATERPEPEASRAGPADEGTRLLRLGGLSPKELGDLIAEGDASCRPADRARLVASSGGNPGLLARQTRARLRGGEPASAGAPVREDLPAELSPAARSLVLVLALLGRPADEALLAAASSLGAAAARQALRELGRAGLVSSSRGACYLEEDAVGPALRAAGEEAARRARERIGIALLEDPALAGEAARHLLHAGRIEEGLAAAEGAARDLREAGRLEEAAALYAAAVELAGPRTRVLEDLGDVEGRRGRFDEASKRYDQALAGRDLERADRLRLLRKLGGMLQRRGDSAGARARFDEALDLLEGGDEVGEQLSLFEEVAGLHLYAGDLAGSTSLVNRGLELLGSAEGAGLDEATRARHALSLHSAAGHVFLRQLEYDRAAAELLRGLEGAEVVGSLSSTALILNNLGIAYHQANRLKEALGVYGRAAELARTAGDSAALLSIRCNAAAIRARRGEIRAAEGMLLEAEGLPHSRRSSRARLFLLHSRGLVARLSLEDARETWVESIRIADELPDPLFESYGRVCLLENEVQQGRWGAARGVLAELEGRRGDPRLERAVAVRQACLEALCGRRDAARELLEVHPAAPAREDHAGLWEAVYAAWAHMELGELERAEALLERARGVFDGSGQAPGSLQCSLLLAETALRARDAARALGRLEDARAALGRHDTGIGSRGAALLFPFLEARAALLSGRWSSRRVEDLLAEASRYLSAAPSSEAAWLLDLVAAEAGEPGASRRAGASRARFAKGLAPGDRESYVGRDHRARLGLGAVEARAAEGAEARAVARRYDALLSLRRAADPRRALDVVLEAAGGARGAVFLEGEPRVAASRGLGERGRISVDRLRTEALRAGTGPVAGGLCAGVQAPGGRRLGVLYLEAGAVGPAPDLQGFLEAAGVLLGEALARSRGASPASPPTGATPSGATTRAGTLSAESLASESPRMREVVSLIQRTRESRLPVLLTGESGCGKDHLARWIHSASTRRHGPFVAQDCSAIPAGLLEAEIFGYEAGAFTGAQRARTGYLLAAQGGTFYLDNVDSLSLEVQSKLVRVLESGGVRPLGGSAPVKVDVRWIASSQRDLRDLVERGEFRKDLFYRLSGICIEVPPLRERAEDVPLLVQHFREQIRGGGPEFTPGAIEVLRSHSWPGNVRELESVVRRLALTTETIVDERQVLRVLGLAGAPAAFPRWIFEGRSYEQAVEDVKREYLLHLFEAFEGDMDRVARELGTTRRNAYLRFSQAGIRPSELRAGRE